jgi:hypothetical protein
VTSADGDRDAQHGHDQLWFDLAIEATLVGIYVLLGLLCYWGALAWESWFLFAFGTVWLFMALGTLLYFMFVPPREI